MNALKSSILSKGILAHLSFSSWLGFVFLLACAQPDPRLQTEYNRVLILENSYREKEKQFLFVLAQLNETPLDSHWNSQAALLKDSLLSLEYMIGEERRQFSKFIQQYQASIAENKNNELGAKKLVEETPSLPEDESDSQK